jgi:acetyl esterase/lipase
MPTILTGTAPYAALITIMLSRTLCYAETTSLHCDLHHPGEKVSPVIIAVHGGAWKRNDRSTYAVIAPYLVSRGYAVISIDYRLVDGRQNLFPAARDDVRTAIDFIRANHAELQIDPDRIALMGDSAGGHLSALVALTAKADYIKAVVGIYGVYDMASQWFHDCGTRAENITEEFLGCSIADNRQLYFDASPLSYAVTSNKKPSFLIMWGSYDEVVDPEQSRNFVTALRLAGFYVRTFEVSAPHFWIDDPIDEPDSISLAGARRIARFLDARL